MTRAPLFAVVLLFTGQVAVAQTKPTVIAKGDRQFYTKGTYNAYASPWSVTANSPMRVGTDYADTLTIDTTTFPARTKIAWRWPFVTPTTGVYGYNWISYGSYDGGRPQTKVAPRQVKSLYAAWQMVDWTYVRATSGNFNLLTECFLTSTAGNGRKLAEVGFMLHTSPTTLAWSRIGYPLGTFTDASGLKWIVTRNAGPQAPYYMFIPPYGADVLKARIDTKGALLYLRQRGLLDGNEWLNGVAFGVEPTGGTGSVTVYSWYSTLL